MHQLVRDFDKHAEWELKSAKVERVALVYILFQCDLMVG